METIGLVFMIGLNIWLSLVMLLISGNVLGKYNIGGVPNKLYYGFLAFAGWLVIYFLWAWILGFIHLDFSVLKG